MEKSQTGPRPLPVEIIQSILQQLDIESYHAARSTCRGWRYAASASWMLSRVLQQTQALMPPRTSSLTGAEWNRYFDQIARLNLLSYRTNVRKTVSKLPFPSDCTRLNVQASSSNGHITVALEGAQLRVYSSQAPWEFSVAPSLYPPWESICRNSMSINDSIYIPINEQYTKYCLAVSSRGDTLAVALGKKIQIYSLRDGDDESRAAPVEYTINQTNKVFRFAPPARFEETDGVVKSLEFTEDDALLRVCIHRETTSHQPSRVRYLGNPDLARGCNSGLSYWQASLNHIYVDSVVLALDLGSHRAGRCLLRGLRLLPSSFQVHSQHRHHHSHHRYTPRKMSHLETTTATRYFIAALQTSLVDSYAIGSITPEGLTTAGVQIHRVLPSRYYLASLRLPGVSNNNNNNNLTRANPFPSPSPLQMHQDYNNNYNYNSSTPTDPFLPYIIPPHPTFHYPYSRRPNPCANTPADPTPGTTTTNLRHDFQRWSDTNLPSATFTSPLLATSSDNRLAVIYEPGGSHTRFVSGGGTLYVVDISSCTPAYQPYAVPRASAAGSPTNSTAAWLRVRKEDGPQDIIPAWPFLLDRLYFDADAVGVEVQQNNLTK
ncbi:F-box protein [Aspergillus candidus]|uniref:F-box domain-containing protein n=1 Tax=Aspergillus candidus TaxID=41067 RepID=A0A2I2F3J0_ASPCN|nr:hypothetical protein BDW47DRAFT_128407 [Aspergillus candidus]PLB35210.1 hypothetical protein BDW47DRAFT_128407 [Aspergillus candidus]